MRFLILELVFGDKLIVFLDYLFECMVLWCLFWVCFCCKELCLILKKKLNILFGRKYEYVKLIFLRLNIILIKGGVVRIIRCWNIVRLLVCVFWYICFCVICWVLNISKVFEELLCENFKLLVKLSSSMYWRNFVRIY